MRIALPGSNTMSFLNRSFVRRPIVNVQPQVIVTLSADLLKELRKEARERHVSLRWLVAGLVCDTMEMARGSQDAGQPAFAGR